jgi:hypothetical protein
MTIAKLTALVVLLASASAHAQAVEAETLFREGKKLLKQGKLAEACEKLEASDRLEASVGTELNLADCRARNHQLASAWATFEKATVSAKVAHDSKRQAEAKRRARELEPRLLYFTVNVPTESRVDGLEIKRNAIPVDPELWNQGVPIDAGEYELTAEAPGYVMWIKRVTLAGEGQKASVNVPVLEKQAVPAEPAKTHHKKPAPADMPLPPEQPVQPVEQPSSWTGTRKGAIVIGILGLAAAGGGLAFGLHGNDLETQSDALCPTTSCNNAMALQLNSDARSAALYSDIGYIAGGALVGTAIIMWIVGSPGVTPVVAPDRVGLAFEARF